MSTVIKSGQQGQVLRRLVTFDLADHMAEARSIVAAAREQAHQILAEARHEGQRLKAEAHRTGYQRGHEQGMGEGYAHGQARGLAEATERFNREQAGLAASLNAIIEAFEHRKQDLFIAANRDLLELAVTAARKVTGCVARLDRDAAVANVEQALRLVGSKTDLTIRIHPLDGQTMRRLAEELAQRIGDASHVALVEDDSIAPGGAVVTSGGMEVDARIETQLEQMTALLLGTEGDGQVRSEK